MVGPLFFFTFDCLNSEKRHLQFWNYYLYYLFFDSVVWRFTNYSYKWACFKCKCKWRNRFEYEAILDVTFLANLHFVGLFQTEVIVNRTHYLFLPLCGSAIEVMWKKLVKQSNVNTCHVMSELNILYLPSLSGLGRRYHSSLLSKCLLMLPY